MRHQPVALKLSLDDVGNVVQLLANAGDPSERVSLGDRKRALANGLASLIRADVWIWSAACLNPSVAGDAAGMVVFDDGWKSDKEKVAVFDVLVDPVGGRALQHEVTNIVLGGAHRTVYRHELGADDAWNQFGEMWRSAGFEHGILSIYPLENHVFSGIGFHRRVGREPFTDRERMLVHLVTAHVEPLHRHGTDIPNCEIVTKLSPRARHILIQALCGDTRKQIASKLDLSTHTVGDYLKLIYTHFGVGSRKELLAHFLAGGPAKRDN